MDKRSVTDFPDPDAKSMYEDAEDARREAQEDEDAYRAMRAYMDELEQVAANWEWIIERLDGKNQAD